MAAAPPSISFIFQGGSRQKGERKKNQKAKFEP